MLKFYTVSFFCCIFAAGCSSSFTTNEIFFLYAKTKNPNIKRAFDSLADGIGTRNEQRICPNMRPQYTKSVRGNPCVVL